MQDSALHHTLAAKTIVVIGGTTGLGRSAALACARAGARGVVMVVGGRSEDTLGEAWVGAAWGGVRDAVPLKLGMCVGGGIASAGAALFDPLNANQARPLNTPP